MPCSHKHQQQSYNNDNTQTLQTWISHNAMRCHNFSALSHVLSQTLPKMFSQVSIVASYFQRVKFIKKIDVIIFRKIDSHAFNPLQIAKN